MNIVFWNCQGLRPKRKELQNYLLENQIDILAQNETFLKPKFKFHFLGYDIYKNDRLVGTKGGVAILVKKGIIVNQEWKNEHFNVITDNEALAVEIELQNGDKVILVTIYCPNGNPNLRLFRMINVLLKQVIFLGDFNSKHKQFGCVKPNKSGQTLLNMAKDLKLFYVNQLEPNRHTREDPVHGTSDILDMAFITPGLSSRDISFSVADNKTAKTNPEKAQLFAESVERNFGIESHLFSKSQFDRINKFVEAHSYHFTPLDSLYDNIADTDDDSDVVA